MVMRVGNSLVKRERDEPMGGEGLQACWKYRVIRSQRRYLEGLINDIDDVDDEY